MALQIAQEPHADEVLNAEPFALVVGMMLDQQYPMEHAFRGPAKVLDRFGTLDPATIAEAEPEAFADLCATPPAIHRYGRSMAGRLQELARHVVEEYDGDASRIWTETKSGDALSMAVRAKITDRITPPTSGHMPRMKKWRTLLNRLPRKYQTQANAVSE